jgi:hypothetical protein
MCNCRELGVSINISAGPGHLARVTTMASMNKCLAQSNKSRTEGKATKEA